MKLFTKGQVLLTSLITAGCIIIAGWLIGVVDFSFQHSPLKRTGASAEDTHSSSQTAQPQSFPLETNTKGNWEIMPVRSPDGLTEEEQQTIDVYTRLNTAVVNINTRVMALNWFLEPVPSEGGTGSGSIIDTRGYVLTNRHVVEKAYEVFITLYDGKQYEGEVIGTDPETDLAVIKFDPGDSELTTIPMGASSDLHVGQKVLAIGNPFGYDRTLTSGIVSGVGRPVKTSNDLVIHDMIQTDASINPGNSGGPLINSSGEMIGINTMIYSPSGGSVGIGFAVAVDVARRVVPDLIQYGTVRRGWIDIVPVQLFPELVRYADLPVSRGILISRVINGGNAEEAGLRGGTRPVRYGRSTIYLGGDIIVEVDGMKVRSLSELYSALEDNRPGQPVNVVVYRGKKTLDFTVELTERPDQYQLE